MKLDEIPKKNLFEVPDGYFDGLPMQIKARVAENLPARGLPYWNLALRYAVPVVIAGFALAYFLIPKSLKQTEELLATVSSEHLIAYLHETDISENELLEVADFDNADADSLNFRMQSQFSPSVPIQIEPKHKLENEL